MAVEVVAGPVVTVVEGGGGAGGGGGGGRVGGAHGPMGGQNPMSGSPPHPHLFPVTAHSPGDFLTASRPLAILLLGSLRAIGSGSALPRSANYSTTRIRTRDRCFEAQLHYQLSFGRDRTGRHVFGTHSNQGADSMHSLWY